MVCFIKRILNKIQSINNIDNIIFKACILGISLIVCIQIFLANNAVKSIIGSNNSNIIPMEVSDINNPRGWVEIKIDKFDRYKNLPILKNGEITEDYIINDDILKIVVFNGDVIEAYGLNYNEGINIQVYDTSDNIISPEKGEKFKINNNIIYLFQTIINQSLEVDG
ncbi:MAG TPA: hypothetical protein GXZ78_08345 [Eubacteriaceae bacterium]|nr:hypothetical protein [Eubacteriaceae bacterium]